MKFTRLELLNWDIQAHQVLVLKPGVNLLTGENGSGKTSILDAIKVVLGGTRIGGDRSVDDYLMPQEAPYVMVRLVADNRPETALAKGGETQTATLGEAGRDAPQARSSRRQSARPFDRIQPSECDHFTLAVVFAAGDEGYTPRWFICPGDVSPLERGFEGKSFTSKSDYTTRLQKLGMGRSFRKLLCTPQGQVASLCGHRPAELFDLLFDFIGGKSVLDEWESLRRVFEVELRERDGRKAVLGQRQEALKRLRDRLRNHERYRRHLDSIELASAALPLARVREAEAQAAELAADIARLVAREQQRRADALTARRALTQLRVDKAATERDAAQLSERDAALVTRHAALVTEQADHRAACRRLDKLREAASALPARDLQALKARLLSVIDDEAHRRELRRQLGVTQTTLTTELARLKKGLLTPPAGVDDFRAVLRAEEVPHHLLMDLIAPRDPAHPTRHGLESYLGDFRFAVAVPDMSSFVRAVALARRHDFPFYVLSPDVRSHASDKVSHPFLAQVQVLDPKYRGLVVKILSHVRWLEGEVQETHRKPGALIDEVGYVVDRRGGRFQGTQRYYLGRDALERRQAELKDELRVLRARQTELTSELKALAARRSATQREIEEEQLRRQWHEQAPEHRRLRGLLVKNQEQLDEVVRQRAALALEREAVTQRRVAVGSDITRHQSLETSATRAADELNTQLRQRKTAQDSVDRELAAAKAERPEVVLKRVAAFAHVKSTAWLKQSLASESEHVRGFSETERDPNLPNNVDVLAKQVNAVDAELQRLDGQVDAARSAADRAHQQYKTATQKIFRRYFALLTQSAKGVAMTIEAGLRPRDDGRFDVELRVGAGDKTLVPYSSPSLSGGQKAALSMLMAMTTLRVHNTEGGARFFLIDEPFSASDTHKIQELGTFLQHTGAQYLVSMPTTEELRRCGVWLESVFTCTQTRGGVDEEGKLRLAPPVKCSYVVHRAG